MHQSNHWLPVGKPTGNRPLGRPRRRWEGNIRMDLGVIYKEESLKVNWQENQGSSMVERQVRDLEF